MYVSREDSDETLLVQSPLSLRWSLMLNMFVYVSRGDSDETSLVHSLLWAFAGHLCSICLCMWAEKILTRLHLCSLLWAFSGHLCSICLCMWAGETLRRLHLCTVSSEPSLVTYAQYFCVCEQERLWRDYTCAQSPLSLRWSLKLHIVCMWAEKILTKLHLCIVFSEPSLVTYAQYCLYISREDSDENALMHRLLWIFAGHLCSI